MNFSIFSSQLVHNTDGGPLMDYGLPNKKYEGTENAAADVSIMNNHFHGDDVEGSQQMPPNEVQDWLSTQGIRLIVTGHQPEADSPQVIRMEHCPANSECAPRFVSSLGFSSFFPKYYNGGV
jgi:hypothetical protein